ncbi:MAG: TOMM precursor leader peptide-binding protein, partial [Gemmatimonadetes bacterium]|nr:TOMM precursor leader peptide-binding protein [Gemmatimonadota bacterium]
GCLIEGPAPTAADDVYWEMLGTSKKDADARLATAGVEVRAVGCGHREMVAAALERHGVSVGPAGETLLVFTDDYQNPELAEVDADCRSEGRPWVLARLSGATAWIGPLFVPGETGCWHCLEQRLRGNRPLEELVQQRTGSTRAPVVARAAVQASLEAALGVLMGHLVSSLGTGQSTALRGCVTTMNPATLEFGTHRLERRPQCPRCGDPELYGRSLEAGLELRDDSVVISDDGGYRVVDIQETVRRFQELVSPITGVVRDVRRVEIGVGSPVQLYVASHAGPALSHPRARFYGIAGESGAGGKGLTELQARASALGEAIERASGVFQGDEVSARASYEQLADRAIHPNECMLFSDRQYSDRDRGRTRPGGMNAVPYRFDPTVELDWTSVWSLTEGRHKYLTTQYLYFAHPGPIEHTFSFADSNGNAAGNTMEEAILQGLLEVIERDAVSLWWYNRLRMPSLDLSRFEEPRVRTLMSYYESLGRQVFALDLTTDLGIPVVAVVSRVVTGGPEQILVGFGCHLDPAIAVARALTEMNQVLAILERLDASRGRLPPDLLEWLTSAHLADHPYLAPDPGRTHPLGFLEALPSGIMDHIDECRRSIEAAGLEVLVLNQTRPDLRIPVVKVIVPGLRHFWARFGPGRLYDVPVAMGLLDQPRPEEDLNPLPMFL